MRKISIYLSFVAAFTMLFASCSKEEDNVVSNDTDKATLSFGAILNDLTTQSTNKQTTTADLPECTDDATPAYVTIALYQDGQASVGSTETPFRVDLVGGQVFTEEVPELELVPGTYTLEHFMVYDSDDNLLWVAPRGGVLGEFIDNPLPLSIDLGAGVKKYVDVSVICYDDRDVVEYGYQFFEIDTNEAIEFCIFGNVCPPPSGRHYPAEYSVSVWSGTNTTGPQLYTDVPNVAGYNDAGDFYAEPLCFALPDTEGLDEYYFEITLRNSDEYGNVEERVIRAGVINDDIVRTFFDGEDNLDYYHFREGEDCGDDSTPIFENPDSETEYYKTCAYPSNGSNSVALTYLEIEGDVLTATVLAAGVTPNEEHPQHIHGFDDGTNSTCPPATADEDGDGLISMEEALPYIGPIQLDLRNEDNTYPVANAAGFYTYQRTFNISGMDIDNLNWEDLSVEVHGRIVDGVYIPTLPVACGQVANLH